jgi:hypothetical protein
MHVDLVLDTNVLMHADNPNEGRQADSAALLSKLLASECTLVVDEGFDLDSSKNTSLIGHEYLERLVPLSVGYQALVQMLSTGRVTFVSGSVPASTRNAVNQVLRNRRDRTFLIVAINSRGRVFCSHDFRDFSLTKRTNIRRRFRVTVCDAAQARALL